MRLRQLFEDGRIVRGVNTTADVGTDEIKKQAAKFGFKVDKDGRPQNHPSKVKGSKTNVLFNLGLTESVAIKFERGDDYDILHIKEKGKNRVEVRGKSGYESGNYDPKDKLHKLLDSLGKAANISELMNGETVVINPKHPDGPKAIDSLTDLEEALGEIANATEIYVDMDGVLADFFGDWAKLMGVDSFRDIKDVNAALEKIKNTDDFWLNLPVTDNAKSLLELIRKVKGEYSICSSPLPGDKNSEPHKREWIKKHLAFFPPKEIIITHDKAKFATQQDGTPNILIDDYGVNINKWEAAGGIGFKHKDHKFERTAKAIKQHMQEPVEEGNLFKNPANTFVVKADGEYDFIKLGTNMANLKSMPANSNVDEPDMVVAPYAGSKEMKYLMKQLKRIGYKVQDAGGYKDFHYDEKPTGGEAPPQIKKLGPLGKIKLDKLKSVQSERQWHKLGRQLVKVLNDDYAPLQIDRKGRVVNGHHRLDALRLTGAEYARVYMVDEVLENMLDEGWSKKYKDSINCSNPKGFSQKAHCAGRKKTNEAFVKPQFDVEWEEAERYPEFQKIGKDAWIKLAKKGKSVTIKSAKGINNTDAANPDSFKSLEPEKQKRAIAQLEKSTVEMPIVAVYSDGYKELIGGNTRLTAMIAQNGKATVWQFEVPDEVAELAENFADGKKKGKSRPGRVKRSGASCKGSVTSLRKRAKNASGEKAKMYHWCANMKSGRKKK
jgi:5'(3')-deoxyribonucleotidase